MLVLHGALCIILVVKVSGLGSLCMDAWLGVTRLRLVAEGSHILAGLVLWVRAVGAWVVVQGCNLNG